MKIKLTNTLNSNATICLALLSAFLPFFANSQTVSTPVVGFQKVTLPLGGAAFAPTFVKANVFSGPATITGSTVSLAANALVGQSLGPTGFSDRSNFPRYYAEVVNTDSPFCGYNFDITSPNGASSFQSLNIPAGLSGNITIAIRPHITLADLDPSNMQDGDSITIYNDPSGGAFTYYQASGGWVDSNGNPGYAHVPVYPGNGVIYGGQSIANTITLTGNVKNTPTAVPVYLGAVLNVVAPVNPSASVNFANQNIASSIGDGASFTKYTADGSLVEESTYYAASGVLVDNNGNPVSSVSIPGSQAVNVGSLSQDAVWVIPAAIQPL
jgi:hypothetical protein